VRDDAEIHTRGGAHQREMIRERSSESRSTHTHTHGGV
jgi:hypothetical protein